MREKQKIPLMVKMYLEDKGYNKADIARKSDIKPDDFYAMLDCKRIMKADDLVSICKVLNISCSDLENHKNAS